MTARFALLTLLIGINGCTSMAGRFADNLGTAIQNQNDPEVVRAGTPTYLLMLDSLVLSDPEDSAVLRASATLNSVYASLFVDDPERAKKMADKSKQHARRAICQEIPDVCLYDSASLPEFQQVLGSVDEGEIDLLYTYGTSWATWVQTHKEDWNAMAQVPKIQAIMERVVELDETYEWGRAHLYLGVIHSQLPPALGGKPEVGRMHFEKAIAISKGEDLIAKVEFARHYCRLVFDQALHDRLLKEVLSADPQRKDLTLTNTLAQKEAKALLKTSAEYFEE